MSSALQRQQTTTKSGGGGVQEFSVRVTVIECRDLRGKDKNMMSDPVCYVQVLDKIQHTTIEKKTLSPYWEQTFFYTLKITKREFQEGKITFSVFNANTFRRNELIGKYEFDLSYCYTADNHEIWRQWIGLYNHDEGPELQGYLRCNIVVLGPGDVPANHEDDEDDEEVEGDDLQKMVLLPPSIERTGYLLRTRCYRADHLPKMDTFGLCDCFVKIDFGSESNACDVVRENLNPVWNQEVRTPVYIPTMSDRIQVRTMDWERVGESRPIATMNFSWSTIVADHFGPAWVNTYGAYPQSFRDKAQASKLIMKIARINRGDLPSSFYKGRTLLTLLATAEPNPRLGLAPIAPCEEPPVQYYTLRFDLFLGSECRSKFLEKVQVFVRIGHFEWASKKMSMKKGRIEFYESFPDMTMEWPCDLEQVPDIVVDVECVSSITGSSRIGNTLITAQDALGWGHKPEWHTIIPDTSSAVYDETIISGFLLYSIDFGPTAQAPPARETIKRPNTEEFEVRMHCYQAKDLPAADDSGTSDPYVMMSFGGEDAKTKYKPKTLFPQWFETLTLPVNLPTDPSLAPPLIIRVLDHNTLGSDTPIGRIEVHFSQIGRNLQSTPKWLQLYMGEEDEVEGELLCSFQLIPVLEAKTEPIVSITPATKPAVIEFRLIGLRNLLTSQFRTIHNPQVEIDLGDPKSVVTTSPSNTPTATSPNILSVIHLSAPLPLNPLYAPAFNCRVKDASGTRKLIGTASIPLGPYLPWSNEEVPRYNLPEMVEQVPGSNDEDELNEDLSPEVRAEKERLKRLKEERERMDKLIPEDITESNFHHEPEFRVKVPEGEEGARTLPDVAETTIPSESKEPVVEDQKSFPHELEFELKKPPFDEFPLYKGQKFGLGYFERKFRDKSKELGNRMVVGRMKGNLSIFTLDTAPASIEQAQAALEEEYAPKPYVVRIYILRGRQLVPMDSNGKADPYIKISNGNLDENKIDDRKNKIRKTLKPDIYKCFELKSTIPGNSDLNVELWDWNRIGSDELIGRTQIDLETRLMSSEWRAMTVKPIEFRTLWSPGSSFPQGKLEMWIEILTPEEARLNPPKQISAPTIEKWQLRVVVWNCADVVFKDISRHSPAKKLAELEAGSEDQASVDKLNKPMGKCRKLFSCRNEFSSQDKSDIFISGRIEQQKEKEETDVHWRSTNGEGNFNWRMVFNVELPCHVPRLKLQIWDKNCLSPDDSIAEAVLHLGGIFKLAYRTKQPQFIRQQWLIMTHPMFTGPQGRVELSMTLVNEATANSEPVGRGQEEPNHDPQLAPPNRPETSFPPWRVDKKAKFMAREYSSRMKFWGLIAVIVVIIVVVIIIVVAI
ncbi:putative C2 domain protein [Blattamonas nauphoetae]|uniref:C2 domain protein n=1 Tax=Blattamonas nauphoetae TaxID=2049346 RepID=A0ABQ9XIM9_9EUKA|nr:putative C2 domain protein [Blattamonas nauphoetae]